MNFKIIKKIGSGSFGTVFLIQTSNEKYFALKRINLNDLNHDDYRRQLHEINILFFNDCPCLLKGIDINFSYLQYIDIITPYYDGGTLDNLITYHIEKKIKIHSSTILDLFVNLCVGIKYLHDNNIIHRDIKPANILIDNKLTPKSATIIDFGVSIILDNSNYNYARTKIGTPYFMSPEQAEQNRKYNNKCDMWALGCILYELVTLEKPFVAHNINALNQKKLTSNYKEISNPHNDPNIELFKIIIHACLTKSDYRRASITDITNLSEINKKINQLDLTNKKMLLPPSINKYSITKNELINSVDLIKSYLRKLKINKIVEKTEKVHKVKTNDIVEQAHKVESELNVIKPSKYKLPALPNIQVLPNIPVIKQVVQYTPPSKWHMNMHRIIAHPSRLPGIPERSPSFYNIFPSYPTSNNIILPKIPVV